MNKNNKTKTYKYLFEPSLLIFGDSKTKSIFSSLTILNVYLADSKLKNSTMEGKRFYILVETDEEFFLQLNNLKSSPLFVDYYSVTRDKAIIVFKHFPGRNRTEAFLESQYSKMYSKEVLEVTKDSFIVFNVKTKEVTISREYLVLTKSNKLLEELVSTLGLDGSLAEELSKKEYDSKLNPSEEIYDELLYDLYNED